MTGGNTAAFVADDMVDDMAANVDMVTLRHSKMHDQFDRNKNSIWLVAFQRVVHDHVYLERERK